jgi:hypothetical protein
MADEHASGGNPYTFLFILAGAMLAAVAFKAVHTGIPLTTVLEQQIGSTATVSEAPAVSTNTKVVPVTTTSKKKAAPIPQDHWTTITLDQDGRVMSVIHY